MHFVLSHCLALMKIDNKAFSLNRELIILKIKIKAEKKRRKSYFMM